MSINIDSVPIYTKPENNITMFLMMLFSGFIFFLLLMLFLYVFSHFFSFEMPLKEDVRSILNVEKNNVSFMYVELFVVSLVAFYSFGFLNFLLSYILITLPSYNIFVLMSRRDNGFDGFSCLKKALNLRAICYCITLGWLYRAFSSNRYKFLCDRVIDSWSRDSENETLKKEWDDIKKYPNPAYKIGLLYFYSRTLPSKLGYEIKVLFQQLMFARTCLSALCFSFLIVTFYFVFIRNNYDYFVFLFFLNYLMFILAVAIYCICIRFFDKTLYGVFMLSKVLDQKI